MKQPRPFDINKVEACSQKLQDLTMMNGQHYCSSCDKCLVDFRGMKNDEITKVHHESPEPICGIYSKPAVPEPRHYKIPRLRSWAFALTTFFTVSLTEVLAQAKHPTEQHEEKPTQKPRDYSNGVTISGVITDKEIKEILGVARGSTVRARNVGRDLFAGLKNIVGGEISEYTKLQAQSREQAMQRMQQDAQHLGADAVVNVRLTTSMVMQGASEILAYGTAVKLG